MTEKRFIHQHIIRIDYPVGNYELHKRLGDFEPFERYMKERTSKTSLEDIIGIVKTDEPTDSVELKKELYK